MGDTLPKAPALSAHPRLPEFDVLFKDVESYAASTTEAADTVPPPAGFHPPLPDRLVFGQQEGSADPSDPAGS